MSSNGMKLYKQLGLDKHSIRGMGLVMGSLKPDDSIGVTNLSPSKLCKWLKSESRGSEKTLSSEKPDCVKQVRFGKVDSKSTKVNLESAVTFAATIPDNPVQHFSIPTFSQLDQDVLSDLPDDILREVKVMYGAVSNQSNPNTSQSAFKSVETSRKSQGKKVDKTIPITGQVSVKRMLKLASIKSGEKSSDSNSNFPLSQLDCLPLEVQLQIVNGDDIRIAKNSPRKSTGKHYKSQSQAPNKSLHAGTDNEVTSCQDVPAETQNAYYEELSAHFFLDNIAPLQDYIKSNPNPGQEEIDNVKHFLSLCIHEKRINDVVIFLRAIKNTSPGWDVERRTEITRAAVDEIMYFTGSKLDWTWLGL